MRNEGVQMPSSPLINSAIEIHDSVLGAIEQQSGKTILRLTPAYIHKSAGIPGVENGSGWVQNAILTIDVSAGDVAVQDFPTDLAAGVLQIDGREFSNMIPLPLSQRGAISLKLVTQSSETIWITGSAIDIELLGKPEYVEEFRR
jgi:hypothetical protein